MEDWTPAAPSQIDAAAFSTDIELVPLPGLWATFIFLAAGGALRDLGAKLEWDRIPHPELAPRYRALDEIAGSLTAIDYQIAELEREAGAVDKKALLIATTVILGGAALVTLIVWLLIR